MQSLRHKIYNWLRWSEKYVKTDMVYLAKGGFWQILGQVAISALSFGLIFLFANYLPKEIYGLYRYILSLAGILSIFTLSGMNQAVSQTVATGNEGALRDSVRYQLKWNLVQFVAFCALSSYYFYNENISLALPLFIIGIFAPLTQAFNTYGAYLEGKRQFRLNNIFSITSTAIYSVGMMLVIMLSGKVTLLILVYALTTFGTTLLFYLVTLHKFNPPVTRNQNSLKYGRELTFISLIGPVVAQIDKIILAHFWGVAQLASYSIATAIPDRGISFIKGWIAIAFPKFSTKTPLELNRVLYLRIFQGLLIGSVCTIGYVMISPYLFTYFLPKYLDNLFYSQLLSISFIFALPNRYISLLRVSQKMSGLILTNSLIENLIRLTSYIILGIWGGILGLVLAQVLNAAISLLINIIMWNTYNRDMKIA